MPRKSTKENTVRSEELNNMVIVNVVRKFKDATDNNREISSGPNSYYRTSKDRADKLVAAGFCKYEDEELEVAKSETAENPDTEEDKTTDTEATDSSNTEEDKASDDSNPNE